MMGNEGFLVDGIIELGLESSKGKLARFIRVEKMRACKHGMEKHTMEVGEEGLTILGPSLG
jgi:KaiC/GvpD/RAD55 family RecA-like ATPase